MTQAGFVRVVSNPAFSIRTITPREALANLAITVKHAGHHFWRDDISLQQSTESFASRLVGHQQITDAYLLGLAIHHKGRLITLDRATLSLLPDTTLSVHLEVLDT
jgi:predicted nucleic acid-binding protein